MVWRVRALVAMLAMAFAQFPEIATAQSDTGEIRIVVTDAATKQPVASARVLLDGPIIASEITAKDGRVDFTDVPDGIYRARIIRYGYQAYSSEQFEVLDGRIVTVSFSLAAENASGLKVIASVSAKSSATVSTSSITQDSAQRRLSDDLAGALNKLSGVTVSTSSDASDATQTISLEGHDASQTQMTLDGIPLNAPGTAGNLRGFASDLFMGASVHMGPVLGGLGGAVNFTTLQPTLSWLSQASLSTGSNGKYNWSFAESGSLGKLGVAVQSVYRLAPSLADGDTFMDASGQIYSHDGDTNFSGNLVKTRYEFGDTESLTATFLNSTRNTQLVCLRTADPPALPCGFGPGNTSASSVALFSLTDDALIGATQLQASVFSESSTDLYDALNQTVAVAQPEGRIVASPSPLGYAGTAKSQGFVVNATLPAKARHTISLQAYGIGSRSTTSPLIASVQAFYSGSQQTGYSALQATDTIHSNDKLELDESLGVSTATGSDGATLLASSGITWNATRRDSFAASYAIGGAAATMGRQTILSAPTQLRFDCAGNAIFGQAPGAQPGRSSSISQRVGYTRNLPGGNISISLYRQVQNGVLLPIYVNGTDLESLFPPLYLSQIEALYDSPAGCNARPGTPLSASQLYFLTPVSGIQRIYEGGELTSYLTLGDLVLEPFYDVTVAKANSGSLLFSNPYSIVVPGGQIPNVPLHRAGITFDYKAPHSVLEWLADAQYTGSNNWQNLPAYTTFDAGVTDQLHVGTITVAASNITNRFGGIFAGPADAVPYVTVGGKAIPTIAEPLQPRSYSVTYSVKFGQGATSTQTASAFQPRERRGPVMFMGPGAAARGGSAPGNARGGFFRSRLSPLPSTPPSDPFALVQNSQTCTDAAAATRLAQELKAYTAGIEAAKSTRGYPSTMPAPQIVDLTVTYHGLGDTYALALTPKDFGVMRGIIGCMTVHLARNDDVSARKLYAPTTGLFMVPQLDFMPSVGLYIVAHPPQAGQEQFRLYKLPPAPPENPFEVLAHAPACTPQARNIATQALGELKNHFATGAATPSWTITPHESKAGPWYELRPADVTIVPALLQCGRVAATDPGELTQRGYAGKTVPEFNYARPLGLYILRPNRPSPSAGHDS